ncbi:hypothetical protein LCGC14_1505050, partial [marine sediment metagenome]
QWIGTQVLKRNAWVGLGGKVN